MQEGEGRQGIARHKAPGRLIKGPRRCCILVTPTAASWFERGFPSFSFSLRAALWLILSVIFLILLPSFTTRYELRSS